MGIKLSILVKMKNREMVERTKAVVMKTVVETTSPGVRIPVSANFFKMYCKE